MNRWEIQVTGQTLSEIEVAAATTCLEFFGDDRPYRLDIARLRQHMVRDGAGQYHEIDTATYSARAVIDAAHTFGWLVHHTRPAQYQSGRWATPIQGDPGFPDLVLARRGRILLVELKSERGRLSPAQMAWVKAFTESDAQEPVPFIFIVWRPEHWTSGEIVDTLR